MTHVMMPFRCVRGIELRTLRVEKTGGIVPVPLRNLNQTSPLRQWHEHDAIMTSF